MQARWGGSPACRSWRLRQPACGPAHAVVFATAQGGERDAT